MERIENGGSSDEIIIELGSQGQATTKVPIECVVDLDGFGHVVGVEIINLAHVAGCRPNGSHGTALLGSGEEVNWSYDEEADAFYAKIGCRRSQDQKCAQCAVEATDGGQVTKIVVESS